MEHVQMCLCTRVCLIQHPSDTLRLFRELNCRTWYISKWTIVMADVGCSGCAYDVWDVAQSWRCWKCTNKPWRVVVTCDKGCPAFVFDILAIRSDASQNKCNECQIWLTLNCVLKLLRHFVAQQTRSLPCCQQVLQQFTPFHKLRQLSNWSK